MENHYAFLIKAVSFVHISSLVKETIQGSHVLSTPILPFRISRKPLTLSTRCDMFPERNVRSFWVLLHKKASKVVLYGLRACLGLEKRPYRLL